MPERATFHAPPEALIESGRAESGVALTLGEDPRAIVHVTLDVRRNHADSRYQAALACAPELAEELGRALIGAAKAARRDLRRFRETGRADD